jgi:carbon storage regulator
MLVLARRLGEKIVIAEGLITITVVEIQADKVRLGIEAPKDIQVNRLEIEIKKSRSQGGECDGRSDVA